MDVARDTTVVFPANVWFDGKKDPMSLQHTLLPAAANGALTDYKINVYTSDLRSAGTSAHISVQLFGDKVRLPPTTRCLSGFALQRWPAACWMLDIWSAVMCLWRRHGFCSLHAASLPAERHKRLTLHRMFCIAMLSLRPLASTPVNHPRPTPHPAGLLPQDQGQEHGQEL